MWIECESGCFTVTDEIDEDEIIMKRVKANICLKGFVAAVLLSISITGCGGDTDSTAEGNGKIELLNVCYDPTREFYAEYNKLFCEYWKEKSG